MVAILFALGWGLAIFFAAAAWQLMCWLGEAEDMLDRAKRNPGAPVSWVLEPGWQRRTPKGARGS